jgi:nicotinamide riboside transporter PnuC
MHIVIIAWLYITLTMALALHSALAGVAFFFAAGVSPVALYAWLAARRRRAARERERLTRAR